MAGVSGVRQKWIEEGLDSLEIHPRNYGVSMGDGSVLLAFEQEIRGRLNSALHYSVYSLTENGICISERIDIPDEWVDIPRVGIRFEVPASFELLRWLGRGPYESYPDRCRSQMIGVWESGVTDQYHQYVVPQEHGAHQHTRWFTLEEKSGLQMRITSSTPFSFSARFHHDVDLTSAKTIADLAVRDTIEVHIDRALRGLGTGACGPDVLEKYRVGPGEFNWDWEISFEDSKG